jgi:hypothetical protein
METDWWYYYTHSTNYTNIVLKTSNAEAIFRIYCHNLNTNIPIYYKWNLWSSDQLKVGSWLNFFNHGKFYDVLLQLRLL